MITNLTITNIKGFGTTNNSFDVNIYPGKVNIVVAPNGFGKSSIATAFNSLIRGKLKVEQKNLHKKDETLIPSLSLTLNGTELTANPTENSISKELSCFVINNRIAVETKPRSFNGINTASGYLKIEEITILNSIPTKVSKYYDISTVRHQFGHNGKILQNYTNQFSDNHFLMLIEDCLDIFKEFTTGNRKNLIEELVTEINKLHGNVVQIRSTITESFFDKITRDSRYQRFTATFNRYTQGDRLNEFSLFYQLLYYYDKSKEDFIRSSERAEYEVFKSDFDNNINHINSTWKDIRCSERRESLVVQFPHADEISNGQRDILTFIIQILKFQSSLRENKKHLLIIDEVFDYLDDANIIAAQYYLSNLLKNQRYTIYPVLLTHLDPKYFRNYIFKTSLLNIVYLKGIQAIGTPSMKKFISFRENLDKSVADGLSLYNDLSKYFFHYHPETIDRSADLPSIDNLKTTWAKEFNLKLFVAEELTKYLSDQPVYDPYAVSLGIRYKLEKRIYDSIEDEVVKNKFLEEHRTDKKLKFAENNHISVPDAYYYLSAIHNDADHLKNENEEKACVYKLNHPVIKNIIRKLFDNKTAIDIKDIH